LHEKYGSGEIFEGGGFGFEGGDGFDEASYGEGVANTALAADETENAAFASKLDGDTNESGDAGAVDLGDAVQDDNDFLGASLNDGLEGVVELVGGLADGKAAVDIEDGDSAGLADVDLHGDAVGHGSGAIHTFWRYDGQSQAERHYTPEGGLHK
jgi:hypothetical protein